MLYRVLETSLHFSEKNSCGVWDTRDEPYFIRIAHNKEIYVFHADQITPSLSTTAKQAFIVTWSNDGGEIVRSKLICGEDIIVDGNTIAFRVKYLLSLNPKREVSFDNIG